MTRQKIDSAVLERCTDCGTCNETCPIFLATGQHGPAEKVQLARLLLASPNKPEGWETAFMCTKCEACQVTCPNNVPIIQIVEMARETIFERWGYQYPRQEVVTRNIFTTGNPFNLTTPRPVAAFPEGKDSGENTANSLGILLHLGCMMAYPLRNMGDRLIQVLQKLEIPFSVSPTERCCGYFVYNTGDVETAHELIRCNTKDFSQYGRVVTACAGCYTFLKGYYEMDVPIVHVIEVIADRLAELGLLEQLQRRVVYADACHVTRPHGILRPPRQILEQIGVDLQEFEKHGETGLCCGADGGMRIINLDLALQMGSQRVKEAIQKAPELVTLCPFCFHNYAQAAEKANIDLTVTSIYDIIAEALGMD